ncbi:FAD-binding monooxygenase [Pseudonocardia sulfidoxydans NBRC 16205]|uniref:FAD-binding monooxygenase n=1 Tax=Pseudonocardia sulfidoxydans NBRC 16205 TaxID=1223511 RepID=A0A511DE91_9PSEU|nr:FAD-dependent monooxygenase [Pseudonocardia sulfidoxydans]GEL23105.1 FAD-binding monooxygenase [Pseudonocardia sulfidoxydans NBRC 16205]
MNATHDTVLIVGAGPVGLTAAVQLARLGVAVRVVEVLEQPTTESRAVGVHARSMELLASLGALDRLESLGRRVPALDVVDGRTGRARVRMDLGNAPSRHPYVLDVAQPDTEAVLAERAAELGVVVDRGVALAGLTQDDDGVDVVLRSAGGESAARYGWVLGADGGHSTTRRLVGTTLEGGFHGQHFAMADADVDTSYAPDSIRMFTHPDGMGMLFPLAGDRARIMFLVDPPPEGTTAPTLAEMQALADVRMGGAVRMHTPRWLTYFEVHHAQVPRYRFGRVFLAGDAAHIHSPAGAQGMNTGIQDAANLAWKLALVAQGRADAALLDSYDAERHPVGAMVVRTTTTLTEVGTASGPEAVLRNVAMFLVGHVHKVRDVAASTMAELTINYRDSALSVHHGRAAVKAGDHAPDPAGTAVAIEDLLATPGFLLVVQGSGQEAALREVLGDLGTVVAADDALAQAYGWPIDGMALIRPDGYLGLVADSAHPDVLRDYLATSLHFGGERIEVTARP